MNEDAEIVKIFWDLFHQQKAQVIDHKKFAVQAKLLKFCKALDHRGPDYIYRVFGKYGDLVLRWCNAEVAVNRNTKQNYIRFTA